MMSVCRLFHGIHELHLEFEGYIKKICNQLKRRVIKKIMRYFGTKSMAIYGLKKTI